MNKKNIMDIKLFRNQHSSINSIQFHLLKLENFTPTYICHFSALHGHYNICATRFWFCFMLILPDLYAKLRDIFYAIHKYSQKFNMSKVTFIGGKNLAKRGNIETIIILFLYSI